ncbi:MAG: esterase [Microbacteriaceae bacterium]|nr:esterase [Microbacteriaceae bacterium]
MWNDVLKTVITEGPVLVIPLFLAAVAVVYLFWRPETLRRTMRQRLTVSAIGIAAGILAASITWLVVVGIINAFGISPGTATALWLGALGAGIGLAVTNLFSATRTRKTIAVASIVLFGVAATLAVNASFGINRTLGLFLGIDTQTQIALEPVTPVPSNSPVIVPTTPAGPLWKTWRPPHNMPAIGTTGSQLIPGTISGFVARKAGIYLPPAAVIPYGPKLPFVIMLMGQPGNPDPDIVASTMNAYAARHNGLAPIVIVADQLGDPTIDTLCLDTKAHGNAETYITQDVVNWAVANLNITTDHRKWTIAGYSNGGQCAVSLIAKYPAIWSNVVDVSGEEFPGADRHASVLKTIFGGNKAAYAAQHPASLLAVRPLPDTWGVFTVGSDDGIFKPGIKRVSAAAQAAGMTVTYYEVPNGGHVQPALSRGLDEAFAVLYPRLELSEGRG